MTSIDEIFKASGLSNKRKLEPTKDPNEIYKSAKLGSSSTKGRHALVEDGDQDDGDSRPPLPTTDDDENADGDYGPAPPEDDDGDDEDGRFFGGGITTAESHVLDYVDAADADAPTAPDKIDVAWLRKTALSLEKRISKNAELRAKFANAPEKFMNSEGDLDADIRALSILAEHPELYAEFARLGCVGSLVALLAHENTDIAIATVEAIGELIGDDVEATEEQWSGLVDALVEADLIGLLVSNLDRLDEANEEDRNGVYYILGVFESLCSRAATAELVGQSNATLEWLHGRIKKDEPQVSQNKQYAAELIAILSQSSSAAQQFLTDNAKKGILDIFELVGEFRKRNPAKGEEEEYMENLFDALCNLVDTRDGAQGFLDSEGTELCLIFIKAGKRAQMPALKLLDHALSSWYGGRVGEILVSSGGLSTLFTLFKKKSDNRTMDHLLNMFFWMFRLFDVDEHEGERIRLQAKFVEKDYQKLDKVMDLRRQYLAAIAQVDKQIEEESEEMEEDEKEEMEPLWNSRRLDAGLFRLRMADRILAWMIHDDDGAGEKIATDLGGLDVIKTSIEKQIEELAAGDSKSEDRAIREMAQVRELMMPLLGSLQ